MLRLGSLQVMIMIHMQCVWVLRQAHELSHMSYLFLSQKYIWLVLLLSCLFYRC